MKTKSILENIKESILKIEWNSSTKQQKALDLCISIYNLFIQDGGDFYRYKSLSREYFYKIIGKKYAYEIKDKLIDNGILEVNNSYNVVKGIGKGYRINNCIIGGEYQCVPMCPPKEDNNIQCVPMCPPNISDQINGVSDNYLSLLSNHSTPVSISYLCPPLETLMVSEMQKLTFSPKVYEYINNFTLSINDITINNNIIEEYVNVLFDDEVYRYKLENALQLANENNKSLIKYKDKCYIDNVDSFLLRKTNDLKLIFKKSIFDIENRIFRASRNETNNRLDYNLTNMKSDILNYLLYDGEEMVELDISNAQFAILSFITNSLDEEFVKLSQNGKLYNKISKEDMFRIAFDKVKREQDDIREIFPMTMKFIDEYKNKFGYKLFSNLLQKTESMIMIDNLLPYLYDKGYRVFTIHDAIRVKKSQVDEVKSEIEILFNKIGFKCNLRIKDKSEAIKETEIIRYKNFKDVSIDKVSIDDKKLFISKINELKQIGLEPSESLLIDMNIFDRYKTWYLYDKWRKNNEYKEVKYE